VTEDELEARALAAASAIAAKPVEAMRLSRGLLWGDRTELRSRMDEEIRLFSERLASDEAKAAFTAFMGRSRKSR
jgi:enoyl-CoA hydratase/carnithine racemase